MSRFLFTLLTVTILIVQQACNNRRQSDTQSADSATTPSASDPSGNLASDPLTNRLVGLGLTRNSHWRGINLGDDFANIQSVEKGESFESDEHHVGYTVEFSNLESMDVLYYRQSNKVSAINVDLFLNNRASVDSYTKDLAAYFSSRFGTPEKADGGTVWSGSTGEQVGLIDVSKGKDFGLKIRIAPAGGATTASAR